MTIASVLSTAFDVVLVLLAFTSIIVAHELGHYLAARWARVRVLAFAVGFGPALVSYRRGMGLRRGSSEADYFKLPPEERRGTSPCEYRFNGFPFGGYVKMLGQDDMSPAGTSTEPDSYQSAPVWKRMVIISAGVVANVIMAAALFIAVFFIGLKTEAGIVGRVAADSPARTAVATNAERLGVTEPGLKSGDRVIEAAGWTVRSFNDVVVASAMSERGQAARVLVKREGVAQPLEFSITPRKDKASGTLQFGIMPAYTTRIVDPETLATRGVAELRALMDRGGLGGLPFDAVIVSANGRPVATYDDLREVFASSGGSPVTLMYEGESSGSVIVEPSAELARAESTIGPMRFEFEHMLGLAPVMSVTRVAPDIAERTGLRDGDVFAVLGPRAYPSVAAGRSAIIAAKGGSIAVQVDRIGENGRVSRVDLGELPVKRDGTIGFTLGDTRADTTRIGAWPDNAESANGGPAPTPPPLAPGSVIASVGGDAVTDFASLRGAIVDAWRRVGAPETGAVELSLQVVAPGDDQPRDVAWSAPAESLAELAQLGWDPPMNEGVFEPVKTTLLADGPIEAMVMGLAETRRIMTMTYLTFLRLIQGSVKVEHLKGPVGITHIGTILAGRGMVWLLFFMALVSINLAVVNFLPIPIADGGHMVFLMYEGVTGKPPPPALLNGSALVGLVLIGGAFLLVTFNDLRNLFGF